MKINLLSSILALLMIILLIKGSMLIERIGEQTLYITEKSYSVLIDTAYAKTHSTATPPATRKKEKIVKQDTSIHESLKKEQELQNSDKNNTRLDNSSKLAYNVTTSEMDLLKELAKRREELNQTKRDLDAREQLITATENKIDNKVAELKDMQSKLESLMQEYDRKEDSRILSLVKIYETMKPKDAAKIFNDLEMAVLLKVVRSMKEVKVAPIIANMDPLKAKELSMELASPKPLPVWDKNDK